MRFLIHPDDVIEPCAQDVYKALLYYLNQFPSDPRVRVALPREVDHA